MDTFEILSSKDPNVIIIAEEIEKRDFKTTIGQILHTVHCPRCNCIDLIRVSDYIYICGDCGLKFSVKIEYKNLDD